VRVDSPQALWLQPLSISVCSISKKCVVEERERCSRGGKGGREGGRSCLTKGGIGKGYVWR